MVLHIYVILPRDVHCLNKHQKVQRPFITITSHCHYLSVPGAARATKWKPRGFIDIPKFMRIHSNQHVRCKVKKSTYVLPSQATKIPVNVKMQEYREHNSEFSATSGSQKRWKLQAFVTMHCSLQQIHC